MTIRKSFLLRLSIALALTSPLVSTEAFAWGAGGGAGPADPYAKEQYKPKNLSPGDRAKLEQLKKLGAKMWKDDAAKLPSSQFEKEFADFQKQVQQLLDQLDNKGYDTNPEYEADVHTLKQDSVATHGQTQSESYNPPPPAGPGSTTMTGPAPK